MNVMSSMVNHLSIISVVQTAIKMEFPTRLTRVLTTLRLVLGLEVRNSVLRLMTTIKMEFLTNLTLTSLREQMVMEKGR